MRLMLICLWHFNHYCKNFNSLKACLRLQECNRKKYSRSSICGLRVCFFCLSVKSASSAPQKYKKVKHFISRILSKCFQSSVNSIVVWLEDLLRGSVSILLRLCWDEADSLGLAGLLFARLSPPLKEKRHVLSAFNTNYISHEFSLIDQLTSQKFL